MYIDLTLSQANSKRQTDKEIPPKTPRHPDIRDGIYAKNPKSKDINSHQLKGSLSLNPVPAEQIYPCALQYAQSRSFPGAVSPLLPPVPAPVPVLVLGPVFPELGPQLPTGGAVFALLPYVTSPPGSGKITSVPGAVEHPLPIFAWKSGVPAARGDTKSRTDLRPPEIVTTAQFMYISRLPCWLNQVLRVTRGLVKSVRWPS